jgi:hypothetical protein
MICFTLKVYITFGIANDNNTCTLFWIRMKKKFWAVIHSKMQQKTNLQQFKNSN